MDVITKPLARTAAATLVVCATTCLAAVVNTPATAATDPLAYNCTFPSAPALGTQVFTGVLDNSVPNQLPADQPSPDMQVTANMTIPADVVAYFNSTTAVTVGGYGSVGMDININFWDTSVNWLQTAVSGTGTMQLTGTGSAGFLPAASAGKIWDITARGSIQMQLTGYRSDGSVTGTTGVNCVLQSGQNNLIETVLVIPAPSTTTITVESSPVEYGAQPSVRADVVVPGSTSKPAGTIQFSFDGKAVAAGVTGGQAKTTLAAALTMGARQVTAAFIPADPNVAPSQASSSLTVIKDQSSTDASMAYRHKNSSMVGKGKVESQHATAATGVMKFVLKRDGTRIRTAKVELNKSGIAKKIFKHISKQGKYTLLTRFLGSPTLNSSVDRARLVV